MVLCGGHGARRVHRDAEPAGGLELCELWLGSVNAVDVRKQELRGVHRVLASRGVGFFLFCRRRRRTPAEPGGRNKFWLLVVVESKGFSKVGGKCGVPPVARGCAPLDWRKGFHPLTRFRGRRGGALRGSRCTEGAPRRGACGGFGVVRALARICERGGCEGMEVARRSQSPRVARCRNSLCSRRRRRTPAEPGGRNNFWLLVVAESEAPSLRELSRCSEN